MAAPKLKVVEPIVEEVTEDEAPLVEGTQINEIKFLNSKEFKVLSIAKKDEAFRFGWQADIVTGTHNSISMLKNDDGETIEDLFEKLAAIALPIIFNDQNLNNLTLESITQKLVNNKNKEPKSLMVFKVSNLLGYTSVNAKGVERQALPESFTELWHELELAARHELEHYHGAQGNQLTLDLEGSEEDEYYDGEDE